MNGDIPIDWWKWRRLSQNLCKCMSQKRKNKDHLKAVIIGCGNVGSACAYALMHDELMHEMVLMDKSFKKAKGLALDLAGGMMFTRAIDLKAAHDYSACEDADMIIITAGMPQQHPGQSRLDLIKTNATIVASIMHEICRHTTEAIIVMVSNPVDVLTYIALRESGYPAHRIFGSGTVLDSARLRFELGKRLDVNLHDISAYILGEHGDSEFPVWSSAQAGGIPLQKMKSYTKQATDAAFMNARNAAYDIIRSGVPSMYGIGSAVKRIAQAVMQDKNDILPLSAYVSDYAGVSGVCVSVPCIVNRAGIKSKLLVPMNAGEKKAFRSSANVLKKIIETLYPGTYENKKFSSS